jgi:hypothetical protein
VVSQHRRLCSGALPQFLRLVVGLAADSELRGQLLRWVPEIMLVSR